MAAHNYILGFDIGSSSVKTSLVDVESGAVAGSTFFPKSEAVIISPKMGWAEQDPQTWWESLKQGLAQVMHDSGVKGNDILAIGISYQMHGLVCVDKQQNVLRPSIIWCDSRAVPYGDQAFHDIGTQKCLAHLLNSPGNFTASKLKWVKENEPELFEKIDKILLPGDYIAMKLSGVANTTISGLSEGMLWDFKEKAPATFLMDYFGFPHSVIPDMVSTFSIQSVVSDAAAAELGLKAGTPISYRAGDQPNNALSLNVLNPGEIAGTAGTSGVVYGILGQNNYDEKGRVNTFAHVNYQPDLTRLGVLLCINGTGILNSWVHRNIVPALSYDQMNEQAGQAPIGSEGLKIVPFGNGAERVVQNRELGCSVHGLNFNVHGLPHLLRAAQEGVAFSFCYGMEVMRQMGMDIRRIHAGDANMFLSPLFRSTLVGVSGASIELYNTDGSIGAARGAGVGAGIYKNCEEAFSTLRKIDEITPDDSLRGRYLEAYSEWKDILERLIKQ